MVLPSPLKSHSAPAPPSPRAAAAGFGRFPLERRRTVYRLRLAVNRYYRSVYR
jgi:hypothetical protein